MYYDDRIQPALDKINTNRAMFAGYLSPDRDNTQTLLQLFALNQAYTDLVMLGKGYKETNDLPYTSTQWLDYIDSSWTKGT